MGSHHSIFLWLAFFLVQQAEMLYTVIRLDVIKVSEMNVKVRTAFPTDLYRCIELVMMCSQELCTGILQLCCIPI